MKKDLLIYRMIAIIMALLIGMTSIGMTINMHFCGGSLRSISLIEGSGSCCSKATMTCGNFEKLSDTEEGKCCENQSLEVQSDDILMIDQVQFTSDLDASDLLALSAPDQNNVQITAYNAADFEHYKPPLIYRDLPVLLESFLL